MAFQLGWISYLLIRNLIIMLIAGHASFLVIYKKTQGDAFKFNPARCLKIIKISFLKIKLKIIFFGPCAAGSIWTAFEVFSLWAFANIVTLLA